VEFVYLGDHLPDYILYAFYSQIHKDIFGKIFLGFSTACSECKEYMKISKISSVNFFKNV